MKIEDFDSAQEVTSPAEIEAALDKRHEGGINAFWLTHGGERNPCLGIFVNGDLAHVHYFVSENHPGYVSVGGQLNLSRDGITNFFLSPIEEPLDVVNRAVVPFSQALKGAQEFAVSKAMPKCVTWRSLVAGE